MRPHRGRPLLQRFISLQFYAGQLKNGSRSSRAIDWEPPATFWRRKSLQFVNVRGRERRETSSESWLNPAEVRAVAEAVRRLTATVAVDDIGVATFYSGQVSALRRALGSHVDTRTVDGFQGREKYAPRGPRTGLTARRSHSPQESPSSGVTVRRSQQLAEVARRKRGSRVVAPPPRRQVIVLSCVRANCDGRLGFLTDRRRLNVALSRARRALLVLGDRATLEHDATWADFFAYVDENRLQHAHLDEVLLDRETEPAEPALVQHATREEGEDWKDLDDI